MIQKDCVAASGIYSEDNLGVAPGIASLDGDGTHSKAGATLGIATMGANDLELIDFARAISINGAGEPGAGSKEAAYTTLSFRRFVLEGPGQRALWDIW